MAAWIPTGYRPRVPKLFLDGNESKYELWEVKFLGYLRIQHLHQIILSPTDQSDEIDFAEKNATVFAELIQYLDDKSLSLVTRDAHDNGRKALTILREHLSKWKPKIISLYTELTSLRKLELVYCRLYDKDREYFKCSERNWEKNKQWTSDRDDTQGVTSEF